MNTEGILKTFAVQSRNTSARLRSTSGGTFFELASSIMDKGGIVCAAGFDNNGMVAHKIIECKEDLYDLQGSKYVQSNLGNSFNNIKKALLNGQVVLFAGTPCQVSGLKTFLGQEYKQLYTIDIICFGVPSPIVYSAWINALSQKYSKKVIKVLFRDKSYGYAAPNVKIVFDNHSYVEQTYLVKSYMKSFMSELNVRPSCSECVFKGTIRKADLTLGDCWHIGSFCKKMDDNIGTTSVFVHSEKGLSLLEAIQHRINVVEIPTDKAIALDGKKMLYSVKKSPYQNEFYNDIKNMDYSNVVQKWFPCSIKESIVSFAKRAFKNNKLLIMLLKKARK